MKYLSYPVIKHLWVPLPVTESDLLVPRPPPARLSHQKFILVMGGVDWEIVLV